jgi:hypothetical protein
VCGGEGVGEGRGGDSDEVGMIHNGWRSEKLQSAPSPGCMVAYSINTSDYAGPCPSVVKDLK